MGTPGRHLALPRSGRRHLPGLDGLRGLAVLAIVVFHLDESVLPGGFLGVDVFFVLSGYLITGLLIEERSARGSIDLGAFWVRRARRLLPAVLVLLAAMALLLPTLDPVARALRVPELLGALAYVANWQLLATEVPYFADFSEPSPVRHLWSLAIEEQFYLLWPILFRVLGRGRTRLIAITAIGAGASVVAMVVLYDPANTTRAYFGTDARVHQLLIGCLAAATLPFARGLSVRMRSMIGLSSLLGLLVMVATVTGSSAWYFEGGSVLVAVLTVGVIFGCEQVSGQPGRLLSFGPLRDLGEISYGLYLWHWPVIVVLHRGRIDLGGLPLALLQVSVSLVLAGLSYRFVEQPIRRGVLRGLTFPTWRLALVVPGALATMAGLVLVAGIGRMSAEPVRGIETGEVLGVRRAAATEARPVTSVALLGDSVAWMLSTPLSEASLAEGLQFVQGAVVGCHVGLDPLYTSSGDLGKGVEGCQEPVSTALATVRAAAPEVILWFDTNAAAARRNAVGELLVDGLAWQESVLDDWDRALATVRSEDTTIVMVRPPWRSVHPLGACAGEHAERCVGVQAADLRIRAAVDAFLQRHAEDPRIVATDLDDVFCPGGLPCPPVVDGIEMRAPAPDLTHPTNRGAIRAGPILLERALSLARIADRRSA